MRTFISTLMLVVVVSCVAGCGNDSTTPQDNTPPTFSKMMGHSGETTLVNGLAVMSDGSSVVVGEANLLDITGSSTTLDGTGTSGIFFAGFRPDGSITFRTFVPGTPIPGMLAMARDANDNLLVTGRIANDLTFGTTSLTHQGSLDIFMAKLDATGHPIWVQSAGKTGDDEGADIAAAPDGSVYACGIVNGEVPVAGEDTGTIGKQSGYLVKLEPGGTGVWQQTAAPAGTSQCAGVAVSQNRSVVVCGSYTGTNVEVGGVILPNDGTANGFIARFDADGTPLGNIRLGGTGAVTPAQVTTLNDEVVVCGTFSGTADFDVNTPAGVVAAVGNDAFVARYSKTGQFQWVKTFGTTGDQSATQLVRTGSGNILVAGSFDGTFSAGSTVFNTAGNLDTFIVRLSGGGQILAVKSVSGPGADLPVGLGTSSDALIVAGTTDSADIKFPDATTRARRGNVDGFIYRQP